MRLETEQLFAVIGELYIKNVLLQREVETSKTAKEKAKQEMPTEETE